MSKHVYLIRNGDLYNLGWTNNLENTRKQNLPGELLASLKSNSSEQICNSLYTKYQEFRLPASSYFRFSNNQLGDIKITLEKVNAKEYSQPFFIGYKRTITFLFFWALISFIIIISAINPILEKFA